MGADVLEDGAGKKQRWVCLCGGGRVGLRAGPATKLISNLVSNLRRTDLHIEPRKQVHRSGIPCRIVEKEEPDLDVGVRYLLAGSRLNLQTRRERLPETGNPLFWSLARARGDDEWGGEWNLR